ncbi:HET-domain-containing protein [Daldinia vernicosa]|uniref:HET-domain-containing protein n=1 Tax=Daldinia vernicosa TaxID=114800 RepID=UPI0020089F31|nr:HET-domain-containing protein [Daldinia vernicosa]KAI0853664.1 HET-domain-containing protein [Daldinia vernicosa]
MLLPFGAPNLWGDKAKKDTESNVESNVEPIGCPVCGDLATEGTNMDRWKRRSILELEASAKEGCKYCLLISKGIRQCVPESELTDSSCLQNRLARVLPRGSKDDAPNRYGICMFQLGGDEHWNEKKVPVCAIPCGDTSVDAAMDQAKEWLEECIKDHDSCGGGNEKPAPTRLIDVSIDHTKDVRLVELNGSLSCYSCLSHCWGGNGSITTTKDNMGERKDRIPWSALCLTFQDAIMVVRRLGLRYIWIDSLCIVQDDKDDWAREAARMASIYENGHLTIAATRSADHDGGCFSKTNPQFETHKVSVSSLGKDELTLYFRQMMPHCGSILGSPEQIVEFPLLDRGWVYQERILSRRVLHFQNNEISWECMCRTVCECKDGTEIYGAYIRPPYRHAGSFGPRLVEPKRDHYSVLVAKSLPRKIDRWHEIVQEYSGLKISYQNDALPALAGLARQMHRHRDGDAYCAGLWNLTLDVDLLWAAEDDRARRPDEWRGPTWSWVSTTSAVNYVEAHHRAIAKKYADVTDGNVRVSEFDQFGQVMQPTWLKVHCPIFEAAVHYAPEDSNRKLEDASGAARYEIHVDGSAVGEFHADYDLKAARGGEETCVPDGFEVDLALMAKTYNKYVYVVLIRINLWPRSERELVGSDSYSSGLFRILLPFGTVVRERIGLLLVTHVRDTVSVFHEDMEPIEEEMFWR